MLMMIGGLIMVVMEAIGLILGIILGGDHIGEDGMETVGVVAVVQHIILIILIDQLFNQIEAVVAIGVVEVIVVAEEVVEAIWEEEEVAEEVMEEVVVDNFFNLFIYYIMNKQQYTQFLCIFGIVLLLFLLVPCGDSVAVKKSPLKQGGVYVLPWNHKLNDHDSLNCFDSVCCLNGTCVHNAQTVNDTTDVDYYDKESSQPIPYDNNTFTLNSLDLSSYYTPHMYDNYYNREARDMQRVAFD